MTSPNDSRFQDIGFDISHNNGTNLDFNKLYLLGNRQVCFLKLTEGTTFVDPNFETYIKGILQKAPKMKLAAYHFGHGSDVAAQMDFFGNTFATMQKKLGIKMLMMLDLERGANPPTESGAIEMLAELGTFKVANPIIYCGYDFFASDHPVLHGCSHFLAEYGSSPKSAIPWRLPSATVFGFDFWQYTGDFLGPWAKDLLGGSHGMDLSVFNVGKNSGGLDAWWAAELAKMPDLTPG